MPPYNQMDPAYAGPPGSALTPPVTIPGQGIPPPPALPQMPTYTPRSPFGVTPNISQYLTPNYGQIAQFQQRTPEELRAIQNVSDLARLISGQGSQLYGSGNQGYQQALAYYQRLLGGDHAAMTEAVAPQGQAISEIYKGAANSLAAGPLRGGARDSAKAEMSRQQTGQIASLVPQARQNAAQAAGQLGLQGAQAGTQAENTGAGIYGQVLGAEQQNRQSAQQQSLQQQSLAAQTSLGAAKLTLDDLVQSGQLGVQEYQALTQGALGMGRLTLDQYLGQQNLNIQQQSLAMRLKEWQAQQSQNQASMWGGILGKILGMFGGGGGGKSGGGNAGGNSGNNPGYFGDYVPGYQPPGGQYTPGYDTPGPPDYLGGEE